VADDEVQDLRAELRALRDIEDIKQLRARYVRLVDTQDWDAWAALLTDDFRLQSDSGVHEGREAVVAMVQGALDGHSTVHHVFTPEIELTGPDTASAVWAMEDWVRLTLDGTQIAFHGCGHYREEYVRTAEGWRVKSSTQTRLRVDPIEPPAE
jgi:hypothetical protein